MEKYGDRRDVHLILAGEKLGSVPSVPAFPQAQWHPGSSFPPFAECAKYGAPTAILAPTKSKAWATRRNVPCPQISAKRSADLTFLQIAPYFTHATPFRVLSNH